MSIVALVEPSIGVALVLWLAIGTPAAVAIAGLDRKMVALLVWFAGPLAWCGWLLARRHDAETRTAACVRRFHIQV